jgi:ketosteroid isomerase-like protein
MSASLLATRPKASDTRRTVSQENVEIVQRYLDHWNETGEPLWAEIAPEAVFVIDPGSFVAGTYRGHEGIRDLLRLTTEVFDQFRYEVDDLVDAGDSVLVLSRIRARGVQSGATGAQHGAVLFHLRDGLIVAYRSYMDRKEALAAVGLGERD